MTLEDLRVFVAVCEAESISAVARTQGCTQPAVAQHLSRLEREVGMTLLERTSRGVVMTRAGRVFYDAASAGLGSLGMGIRELRRLRDGTAGRLTVATGGTTVRHVLSEAVTEFGRRFPDVTLQFEPANSTPQCLDLVARRTADLAFITMGEEVVPGFERRAAIEFRLVLLVRKDDPLAARRRLRARELGSIRCIALSHATLSNHLIATRIAEQGAALVPTLRVDDHDTARVFVELGLGQSIMPALHAAHFVKGGAVRAVPIEDLAPIRVGWAARSFHLLPPVAHDFMRSVSRVASRWGVRGVTVVDAGDGEAPRRSRRSTRF
jgi:DNA-binding transcriptional LysR family regulator